MTDHLTKKERSWNMSRVRSRDTKPELIIRSLLHRAGYRFRINDAKLPGSPDILLPKYRTSIFVHGCFWHRHENCPKATIPSTNRDYWLKKFERNIARDSAVRKELKKLRWRVIVVWECEVMSDPLSVSDNIVFEIDGKRPVKYAVKMDRDLILKLAEKRSNYLKNREDEERKI